MRSTAAGCISHGPQLHYWNLLLERFCSFGGAPWAFAVKIVLDQTIFSLVMRVGRSRIAKDATALARWNQ